jgi:hypothetical protein
MSSKSQWKNGITGVIPLEMSPQRKTAVGFSDHVTAIGFDLCQDWHDRPFKYSFSALRNVDPFMRVPDTPTIYSDKPLDQQLAAIKNRFMYQIARSAWFILRKFSDLSAQRQIQELIRNAHHMCIICGTDLGTEDLLYRSTTCGPQCSIRFRGTALEVRVPELHRLLSRQGEVLMVFQAALLAAFCLHESLSAPMSLQALTTAFTNLIEMLPLVGDTALAVALIKNSPLLELAVAWSSTHYRGCLIQTDVLGDHPDYSLFLFNGRPKLELAYGENSLKGNKQSLLVFHGTTMDRLYPIMSDGLKFDSHLEQNARLYGQGIYVTNDSNVAMTYARNIIRDPRAPSTQYRIGWRVLLVCELLQPDSFYKPSSLCSPPSKVYVVDKPDMLILRGVIAFKVGQVPTIDIDVVRRALWESVIPKDVNYYSFNDFETPGLD